jgi:C4-dicarboxylate transporter DctM subunit
MSTELIIAAALGVFVLMLIAEAPVAAALAAGGITGLVLDAGFERTGATLSSAAHQATDSYALVVVPMFILMGVLVANSGVLTHLFDLAARVTRRLPGGLGIATVMSAAGFSAVTGSSAAAVVTLGRMCVGEMRKHGYNTAYAASIVAASGTLGVLIPPSVVLVIYGILTNESVGQLLLAAIVPGIMTAFAYVITVMLLSRKHVKAENAVDAELASVGGAGGPLTVGDVMDNVDLSVPKRGISRDELASILCIAVIAFVVLGGIYSGVFTETEAGAMGALIALIVLLLRSRHTEQGVWRSLGSALQETAANTAMLVALLIAGGVFTLFLVTTRIPQDLASWITGLDVNKYVVIVIILLVMLVLGALLDGMSILLLTIPLTYPIVTEMGFSGLWYGILAVKMIEVGLLTPPFGLNVFMISSVVKEAKVESVFRGVVPFIVAEMVVVAILVIFPDLVTWLPSLAQQS